MPSVNGDAEPPLRVLVVDDDQDNNATLAMLIGFWGHECRCAGDGRTAVARFGEYRPDVILADIAMPHFTGLDLARSLTGEQRPVMVAISGLAGEVHQQEARDAGFDLFLAKPADPAAIQRVLDHARALKEVNRRTERLIAAGELLAVDCRTLIDRMRATIG